MSTPATDNVKPVESTAVRIRDNGDVLTLEYTGALTEHKSSLWWGTAVGFRAMQAAASGLSRESLWSRDNLYIVSGHPGPGVLDAIDYVTRCVQRDRCAVVHDPDCQMKCNSNMKFEWWISDGERTAVVKLREDFVPIEFYELSDRLFTADEREDDRRLFDIFKVNLSTRIWNAPLEESFSVELLPEPMTPGEMPKEAREWYDGHASI